MKPNSITTKSTFISSKPEAAMISVLVASNRTFFLPTSSVLCYTVHHRYFILLILFSCLFPLSSKFSRVLTSLLFFMNSVLKLSSHCHLSSGQSCRAHFLFHFTLSYILFAFVFSKDSAMLGIRSSFYSLTCVVYSLSPSFPIWFFKKVVQCRGCHPVSLSLDLSSTRVSISLIL